VIRIREGKSDTDQSEKVFLALDNQKEIAYDSYPVVIRPPDMDHLIYKASVLEKQMRHR